MLNSLLLALLLSTSFISCTITSARELEQYVRDGNEVDSVTFSHLDYLNEVVLNESLLALMSDDILSVVSLDRLNEESIRNINASKAKYIAKGCDANILLMKDSTLHALDYSNCVEPALLLMQNSQDSYAIETLFARLSSSQLSRSWQMLDRASLCSFLPSSLIVDIYNDINRRGALKSISSDCFASLKDLNELLIEPELFSYLPEHLWKSVPLSTFSYDSLRNIPPNVLKSLHSSCDARVLDLEQDQLLEIPLDYILGCAEQLGIDDFNSLIVRLTSKILSQIFFNHSKACAKIRASTLEDIVNAGLQSSLLSMSDSCLKSLIDLKITTIPDKVLNSLSAELFSTIPLSNFSSDTLKNFGYKQVSGLKTFFMTLGLLPDEVIEFINPMPIFSDFIKKLDFLPMVRSDTKNFFVKLFATAMKRESYNVKLNLCKEVSSEFLGSILQSSEVLNALPDYCIKLLFSKKISKTISADVAHSLNADILQKIPIHLFSIDALANMDHSLLRHNSDCSSSLLGKMPVKVLLGINTMCFLQAFFVDGKIMSNCPPNAMKALLRRLADDIEFCTHVEDSELLTKLVSSGLGDDLREIPTENCFALSGIWNTSERVHLGLLTSNIFESELPSVAIPMLSLLRADQVQLIGSLNPHVCTKLRANIFEAEKLAPLLNFQCYIRAFSILHLYSNLDLISTTIFPLLDGSHTISFGKKEFNFCQIIPAKVFLNLHPDELHLLSQVSSSCLSMMPGIEAFDLSAFLPYMKDDIFDLFNRGIAPNACRSLEVRHANYISREKNAILCASINKDLLSDEVGSALLLKCGEMLGNGHVDLKVQSLKEYALAIRIADGSQLQPYESKLLETEYSEEVNRDNFPSILSLLDSERNTINISVFDNDVLVNIHSILPFSLFATVRPEQMTDLLCTNYTQCQWDEIRFPNIVPLPEDCLRRMKVYEEGVIEKLKEIVADVNNPDFDSEEKLLARDKLIDRFTNYEGCLRKMVEDNSITLSSYNMSIYFSSSSSAKFLTALGIRNPVERLLLSKRYYAVACQLNFSPSELTNEYDMKDVFKFILEKPKYFFSLALKTKDLGDDGPGPLRVFVQSFLEMNRQFLKRIVFNGIMYQIPEFMAHRSVGTILGASIVKALSLSISPQISLPPFFFDLVSHANSLSYVKRHFYMFYSKDLEAFKSSIIKLVLNKHPEAVNEPDTILRFDFPPLNSNAYGSDQCFGFYNPLSPYEISRSIPSELEDDETWMFPSYTYKTLLTNYIPAVERRIIIEFQQYLRNFNFNFCPDDLQTLAYSPHQNIVCDALNLNANREDLASHVTFEQDIMISSMIPGEKYFFSQFIRIFYTDLLPEKLISTFYALVTGSSGTQLSTKLIGWIPYSAVPDFGSFSPFDSCSLYGNVVTPELVEEIMAKLFEIEKGLFNRPDAEMPPLPTKIYPAIFITCYHRIVIFSARSSAEILLALLFHFNYDMKYIFN